MGTGFGWDFKSQYQKCQWEKVEYKGREYTAALYGKSSEQVACITLNRPEKRNAFNDKMFADMLAGLHEAYDDPSVKVVIIKAAGPCFSAGHDLSTPEGEESPPVNPSLNPTLVDYYGFERRRCSKYEDVGNYPKPLIARVHGFCIGAGEAVAMACDMIIASDDAQFGRRGFGRISFNMAHWPGFWPAESNKVYGGQVMTEITGAQAAARGLITRAVPVEQLDAEVDKYALALTRVSPEALTVTKEWYTGLSDVTGMGAAWRNHFATHTLFQYVRFRKDEVNLHKTRGKEGLKSYINKRQESSTVNPDA